MQGEEWFNDGKVSRGVVSVGDKQSHKSVLYTCYTVVAASPTPPPHSLRHFNTFLLETSQKLYYIWEKFKFVHDNTLEVVRKGRVFLILFRSEV